MSELTRRERAIAVAQELAEEGGWDAVAMRAVSEQSGSALATLYREFPSKTHLVLGMAGANLAEVRAPRPVDVRQGTPAELAGRLLVALTRAALTRPLYTAAVLQGVLTAGPDAVQEVEALRGRLGDMLLGCFASPTPQDHTRIGLLIDVWFAEMLSTVHERQSPEACIDLLRAAATLVLR